MSDIQPAPTKIPSNAETLLHRVEDEAAKDPFGGVDFAELELSLYRPRTMFSIVLSWIVGGMTMLATAVQNQFSTGASRSTSPLVSQRKLYTRKREPRKRA